MLRSHAATQEGAGVTGTPPGDPRQALADAVADAVAASCPPTATNPYRGPGGRARAANLAAYLRHYAGKTQVDALLVLEAAGRNGSARTGVPATNYALRFEYPFVLRPDHASMEVPAKPDNTSRRVWDAAWSLMPERLLCWNAVPWHPATWSRHDRPPLAAEVDAGAPFLAAVVALMRPRRIIPVGRVAEQACSRLPGMFELRGYVPHPAQDKAKDFALLIRQELAA